MAIRRTPFDELDRMMTDMRHAMFGDLDAAVPDSATPERFETHVSVESNEDGHVVAVDLPGFETEEIDLRFDDGILLIEAEHETEDDFEDDARRLRSIRNRRVFERVRLPGAVVADEITASYSNGVVEVRVPTEEAVDDGGTVIDIE